jgi:hypothetical protein
LRTLMKYENTGQDAVLKGLEFAGSIIWYTANILL